MAAFLVLVGGQHAGRRFYLNGDRILLGRHSDCDVSAPFKHDQRVSRRHAEVTCTAGRYFVSDLQSRSGTFVNGQRTLQRRELRRGDRVAICGTELALWYDHPNTNFGTDTVTDLVATSVVFDEEQPVAAHVTKATHPTQRANEHAPQKLLAVVEILNNLSSSLDVEKRLTDLLVGLFKIFPNAFRGLVGLTDKKGVVQPRMVRFRDQRENEQIRVSRTLFDNVIKSREAVLSVDIQSDERFSASQSMSEMKVRSLLCAPIVDQEDEVHGVIQLETGEDGVAFTQIDLEIFCSLAHLVSIVIRTARMHEQTLEREAIDRDLRLAEQMQHELLPASPPDLDGYEFFSYYKAAYEVGGDYFDYIKLSKNRWAIVIADAAGKGISAALFISKVAGETKYCISNEQRLEKAIEQLNDTVCDVNTGRFATMCIAVIDVEESTMTIVNAGHTRPLLRRSDGSVGRVASEQRNPALGIIADTGFDATTIQLDSGDALLFYTDGATEAMNRDKELFGNERLESEFQRSGDSLEGVSTGILEEIHKFTDGHPQSDDICLVGFRVR